MSLTNKTIDDYLNPSSDKPLGVKRQRIEDHVIIQCDGGEQVVLHKTHPFLKESAFDTMIKLCMDEKNTTIPIRDMTEQQVNTICIFYKISKSEAEEVFYNTIIKNIINTPNKSFSLEKRNELNRLHAVCDKYGIDTICKPLIAAWAKVIRIHSNDVESFQNTFGIEVKGLERKLTEINDFIK